MTIKRHRNVMGVEGGEPHPVCGIWEKDLSKRGYLGLVIKDEWELSRNMGHSGKKEEHGLKTS